MSTFDPNDPAPTVGDAGMKEHAADGLTTRITAPESSLRPFPRSARHDWAAIEAVVLSTGPARTYEEILADFGVGRSQFYAMARRRRWSERRALLREVRARDVARRALASSREGLPEREPSNDAEEVPIRLRTIRLVERMIRVWEQALAEGHFRPRSARDLGVLVELLDRLRMDAAREAQAGRTVTVADVERIARKVARRLKDMSPALAGVLCSRCGGSLDEGYVPLPPGSNGAVVPEVGTDDRTETGPSAEGT